MSRPIRNISSPSPCDFREDNENHGEVSRLSAASLYSSQHHLTRSRLLEHTTFFFYCCLCLTLPSSLNNIALMCLLALIKQILSLVSFRWNSLTVKCTCIQAIQQQYRAEKGKARPLISFDFLSFTVRRFLLTSCLVKGNIL